MKRSAFLVAIAIAATSATAQTMPATTQATTRPRGDFRAFTVSPMATPTPALKYQLQPDFADQIDGNAAPQYLQALLLLPDDKYLGPLNDADDAESDDEFVRRLAALEKPDRAPLDTDVPQLIQTATLRTACDWEFPARFEGVRTLLPNLNRMREMANLLQVKFRLALTRNDLDAAIRLLQASTVLADRTDDGESFVVNNLVSVGIQAQCMRMIERLMQRPDGPNLYWALRRYPVPFGNLRGSIETERAALLFDFPVLRKARAGDDLIADDWRQFTRQMISYTTALTQQKWPPPTTSLASNAAAGAMAMMSYLPAKAYYVRTRHVTDEQTKKIDPLKLTAIYAFESYQQASDAMYAWFALPYPQMLLGLAASAAKFEALKRSQPANLFLTIAPSLGRIAITNARLDRTIAAITVVESLRAYAAAHDGALPPTLDAIVETPAPDNPVTGKPFDYAVSGDVATIGDAGTLVDWPLRYEVRLRR